jgi:hypothetical protein
MLVRVKLNVILPWDIMPNVIMLIVVKLNVVAPMAGHSEFDQY